MMPEPLPTLLKDPRYCLAGLLVAIAAIYVHLNQISGDTTNLIMGSIFLFAVGLLLWERRHTLDFCAPVGQRLVGVAILAGLMWNSQWFADPLMLRLFPFVGAVAVSAIASGFRGWRYYRQELLILGFSSVPIVVGTLILDTTLPTAIFSSLLLWYAGYDVGREGVYITLAGGGVEVEGGCSGLETMSYLLGVSVLFLVMFPIHHSKRFFIPLFAILLGFVINSIRVALLAVLSAAQQPQVFAYWHEGQGSMLFGLLGILLLVGCHWLSAKLPSPAPQDQAR